jgi:hypothetical protein
MLTSFSTAEVTTGVVCACLPCLPSLIRQPNRKSSTTPTLTASDPRSALEESSHSYPHNKDLRYGTYIELDKARNSAKMDMKKEVVTTVKGGAHLADSLADGKKEWLSKGVSEESGNWRRNRAVGLGGLGKGQGIVRTVRIEQTGGL